MKRSKFAGGQIVFILRHADEGGRGSGGLPENCTSKIFNGFAFVHQKRLFVGRS